MCGHWFHQICALYNDLISVTGCSSSASGQGGGGSAASGAVLGTGYVPKGHYECPLCKLETMEKHCRTVTLVEAKLLNYQLKEDTKLLGGDSFTGHHEEETTVDSGREKERQEGTDDVDDKIRGEVRSSRSKIYHSTISTTLRAATRSCSKTLVDINANSTGGKVIVSSSITTPKTMLSSSIMTRGSKSTAADLSAMVTSTVAIASSSLVEGLVAPPPTRCTSPSLIENDTAPTSGATGMISIETEHEEDMSSVDDDNNQDVDQFTLLKPTSASASRGTEEVV